MTIIEQLCLINQRFHQMHEQFEKLKRAEIQIGVNDNLMQNDMQNQFRGARIEIESMRENIMNYVRHVQTNTPVVLSIQDVSPVMPDQNLTALFQRIDYVDENSSNDPVAREIMRICSQYLAYLELKEKEVIKKEQELHRQGTVCNSQEKQRIKQQRHQIMNQAEAYLYGEDMKVLVKKFAEVDKRYGFTMEYFRNPQFFGKSPGKLLYGYEQFPMDVPRKLLPMMKQALGRYFDESSGCVKNPCGFEIDRTHDIYVEYTAVNERSVKRGIQGIVLNILRYFKPEEFRISILDSLHYNAELLGNLSALAFVENGVIDRIPSTDEAMKKECARLATVYQEQERRMGILSLQQYNKNHEGKERFPFRILILNRMQESNLFSSNGAIAYLINNAEKLGILVLTLEYNSDGGSKGEKKEKKYIPQLENQVRIISDRQGCFYRWQQKKWCYFEWMEAPENIPIEFLNCMQKRTMQEKIGTDYFKRFQITVPKRSTEKRRNISVPFAVDKEDKPVYCTLAGMEFAAYIMGAAGSGKSTLLHTIICGLAMNYHPDEVELWLMDFKKTEFIRYIRNPLPHVKYILLENSETLVADIIETLTKKLNEREILFKQNGWTNWEDVPVDVYLPAIVVIIDEFAQMSQIIKVMNDSYSGISYSVKLENLLVKGRALGFKFIFSSQNYTTGVTGLTDGAKKQIQLRLAMKNSKDEILQTLEIVSSNIRQQVEQVVDSLPQYETIYRYTDENGKKRLDHYQNLFMKQNEVTEVIRRIGSRFSAVSGRTLSETEYQEKFPVYVDADEKRMFRDDIQEKKRCVQMYQAMESADTIFLFPGIPCSMNRVIPFQIESRAKENILLAGGSEKQRLDVIRAIAASCGLNQIPVEIWGHEKKRTIKNCQIPVQRGKREITTDIDIICSRIEYLRKKVENREEEKCLICLLNPEWLLEDIELFGTGEKEMRPKTSRNDVINFDKSKFNEDIGIADEVMMAMDLSAVLELIDGCKKEENAQKLMDQYNRLANAGSEYNGRSAQEVRDVKKDLEQLWTVASRWGIHFMVCLDDPDEFSALRLKSDYFKHKLLFQMTGDEAFEITGSSKAGRIEPGMFCYRGKKELYYRPYEWQEG